MTERRILVTGAAGFVGGAALKALHESDAGTIVALRRGPGPTTGDRRITWRELDLLAASAEELERLVRNEGVTHCLHCAWYTKHEDYLVAEMNRAWRAASLRLAHGFHRAGGRRFVGVGTCIEYDQSIGGRFAEDAPLQPDTLYGRCKVDFFRALQNSGADHAWARIFFVYGPGDRAGRLVPLILDRLSRGETVGPKYGGLRRDYIHVDDLGRQLARICTANVQGAINTGSGEGVGLATIAEIAAKLQGRPELVDANDDLAPGLPALIEADLSKFRNAIGTPGARSLHAGLAGMIAEGSSE